MELREEVDWFAFEMEKVLRANDHKTGWEGMDFGDLLNRIDEELQELEEVLGGTLDDGLDRVPGLVKEEADCIIKEAVDIANFCMFIACNASRHKKEVVK